MNSRSQPITSKISALVVKVICLSKRLSIFWQTNPQERDKKDANEGCAGQAPGLGGDLKADRDIIVRVRVKGRVRVVVGLALPVRVNLRYQAVPPESARAHFSLCHIA